MSNDMTCWCESSDQECASPTCRNRTQDGHTMKTALPPEMLTALIAQGQHQARENGGFANPHTTSRAASLIRERGEAWAASVLLRRLDRRSQMFPDLPWLNNGEPETLVLAADAEIAALDPDNA